MQLLEQRPLEDFQSQIKGFTLTKAFNHLIEVNKNFIANFHRLYMQF